jgi:hypothetical protein
MNRSMLICEYYTTPLLENNHENFILPEVRRKPDFWCQTESYARTTKLGFVDMYRDSKGNFN